MNKKAFTFVELIVATTIIIILAAIGFYSYSGLLGDSRDSQRKSDLSQISSSLKVYKQKRGYYATPGDRFNLTFSGITVAYQGFLNKKVKLNSLEKLPIDPKADKHYTYSTTANKQEFQLFMTLENNEESIALVGGDYKTASRDNLPVLGIAKRVNYGNDIELKDTDASYDNDKDLFIFDNQFHNLPYTIEEPNEPYSDGVTFDDLMNEMIEDDKFWQNTDYRNCIELQEAKKLIIPLTSDSVEYQIIDDDGNLTNTGCTL